VDIVQTKSCANYPFFSVQRGTQIILYSLNCGTLVNSGAEISVGQGRICITNATPGATYVISVKYDSKSLIGASFSGLAPTCTYTFESFVNGQSLSNTKTSINLVPNCTVATTTTGYKQAASETELSVYPNPFRDQVTFRIRVPESGKGSLKVYNAIGQLVSDVYEGNISSGSDLLLNFKPQSASGSLFYIFEQNGKRISGKMIKVK
jgi:hypothetical protein